MALSQAEIIKLQRQELLKAEEEQRKTTLSQAEIIELQRKTLSGEAPTPIPTYVPTLSAKEVQAKIAQERWTIIQQARAEQLIPKEAQVMKVTPSRQGYQITYVMPSPKVPTWKETTATGRIMERGYVWKTGARLHMGPKIYEMTPEEQKRVLASTTSVRYAGAGFVSVAEQWGGIIGKPTPPGPVSGAIGVAIGQPKAWEEYMETPTLYKVGQVPAMVFESALTGIVAGKLVSVGKKGVGWVAKTRYVKPIAEPITRAVKFGRVAKAVYKGKLAVKRVTPSFRGSRIEQFLIGRVPRYAKRAAKGIRGRAEVAPGIFPKEPLSMAKLKGIEAAWLFETTPRTSAVTLGKIAGVAEKGKPIPHMIIQKVAGQWKVTGPTVLRELYFEEPIWKRGLLPYVTQTQVTRMGIIPHIPKIAVSTGKKTVSTFGLGLSVATVAKAITVPRLVTRQVPKIKRRQRLIVTPKPWKPTLTLEREKFRPLTILEPKLKQRERLVPALKIPTIQYQPQPPTQITPPTLIQPPILRPPTLISPPTKTPPIPPFFPPIKLGGGTRGRAADKRWFARWWRKQQRIKTPKQMLKTYFPKDKTLKKVMEVF